MKSAIKLFLAVSLSFSLVCGDALARGGGGFRGGGGGGGFRPGGFGGGGVPSFNRTPSFSMPAARPQVPNFNMPAARPQMPSGGFGPNLPQRPTTLPGNFAGNRPNLPQRPTILPGDIAGNRPNFPGNNVNRPGFPGNNLNRPGWVSGNPAWSYRPGWAYHQGWINGYWHGQNNNLWNNWGGFATGLALGGIGAWGIGSSLWNWGYMPYSNPYYGAPGLIDQGVVVDQPAGAAAPVVYDYSQPLSTEAIPPEDATTDQAVQVFDAGRTAFLAGNYAEALQQTDAALKVLPSDAAIHEFRALCLFALKQYDPAAATLYAVLSAGPGWDWTTLVRLYPGVDVYTAQLRDLEAYITAHPQSASARFVLSYHYLTQGHTENAVEELKEVLKLQPSDRLSAQIVAQLSGGAAEAQTPGATATNPPVAEAAAPPASAAPANEGKLVGTWKASPAQGTTIELTADAGGAFRWTVTDKGKARPIEGKYTYGNGILAMSQSDTNTLVGKVTWQDDGHFLFQAMGGGPGDPGLAFSK
jgi:tetratricopeptide (TPR) repeat protein